MFPVFKWSVFRSPLPQFVGYSGDLNSEHLNNQLLQMAANSSLFKPSVTQLMSQTAYDVNSQLLVCYSGHVLNNKLLLRYSSHDLNNKPFE